MPGSNHKTTGINNSTTGSDPKIIFKGEQNN